MLKRRNSDLQTLIQMHETYKDRYEKQKARFRSEYNLEPVVPGTASYNDLDTGHQDLCRQFYGHVEVITAVALAALCFDAHADCLAVRRKNVR
jgi:hypothetical protein